MKRSKVLAAMLTLFFLTVPCALQAQLWDGMTVSIPFGFYVGDKKLPPGEYSVIRGTNSLVRMTDHQGSNAAILTIDTPNKTRSVNGALVFNQYGNDHFLAEIQWQSHFLAGVVQKSKLETQIARNLGATRTQVASVQPR